MYKLLIIFFLSVCTLSCGKNIDSNAPHKQTFNAEKADLSIWKNKVLERIEKQGGGRILVFVFNDGTKLTVSNYKYPLDIN